jgi:ribulose-phosphate 3-epimerase
MEHLILLNTLHLSIDAILPSLLSADSMYLGDQVQALMAAGITKIHLDVMDNQYVPNLTYGPEIARGLRRHFPDIVIDVHLMTAAVDELIMQFAQAGADRIAIHPDSSRHLDRSLQLIRDQGCLAGLALNPSVSPESITWCIHRLDYVLIMTVNPGFGGQQLITPVLPKIQQLQQTYPELLLCIDGGITEDNIASIASLGAREFVMGSALFKHANYAHTLHQLQLILGSIDL